MNSHLEKWNKLLELKDSLYQFDFENRNYLIDTNSCNFCEIDLNAKQLVSQITKGTSFNKMKEGCSDLFSYDSLVEVLDELFMLYSNGFLVSQNKVSTINELKDQPVSTLCLIMATDCNLRCRYCFAKGGSYNLTRKKMSSYVAETSVDFLLANSWRKKSLSLSFFGGEPLLNLDVIKRTVRYAKKMGKKHKKKFSFNITTNGTILNQDIMDFLVKNDFGIIISLDGPKEVNDKQRVFPNGSGTYELVANNLEKFVKRYPKMRHKITIRGTITIKTKDISKSLYHLKKLGFSIMSLETVMTQNTEFEINDENISKIFREYNKVAKRYLESLKTGDNFSFFHLHQMFFQVSEGTQRISQCGAGVGYLSIDPEGEIYPCHRFVGDSRFVMGTVFHNEVDPKIKDVFRHSSVNNKEDCKNCWAKYICGGGCHATAIQFNDDILKPHKIECELMKHRIKLGTWIYSQLNEAPRQKSIEINQ
ncbi:MAG: hypothetical protein CW691_08420 [Candidatus Bathyarchaeum sp.]|nr:MAG: hypothetical protein CW691_08420 [Candidatus Bathyarchaeum sp.]